MNVFSCGSQSVYILLGNSIEIIHIEKVTHFVYGYEQRKTKTFQNYLIFRNEKSVFPPKRTETDLPKGWLRNRINLLCLIFLAHTFICQWWCVRFAMSEVCLFANWTLVFTLYRTYWCSGAEKRTLCNAKRTHQIYQINLSKLKIFWVMNLCGSEACQKENFPYGFFEPKKVLNRFYVWTK